MIRKLIIFFISFFYCISTALAEVGATLTLPIIPKDPSGLHGYRASLWYQPPTFIWQHLHVFFDASFGQWWVTGNEPNKQINIAALAPTLRFYFKNGFISPFMDFSLGLAYLSKTRIKTQNLGIHFAFQDIIGVGATIGREQKLSIGLSAIHYSNGSICSRNSGITIPLLLNVGYRF